MKNRGKERTGSRTVRLSPPMMFCADANVPARMIQIRTEDDEASFSAQNRRAQAVVIYFGL